MDVLEQTNGRDELKSESIYRLIIVAGLRTKQLLRGSTPRIEANVLKRKNTSIALEEVRRGLVRYTSGIESNGSTPHKETNPNEHPVNALLSSDARP